MKITLRLPDNRQRPVTLPDDIPLSRLVPALANKLKLPFTDQGETITYHLYHENSQAQLASSLTLANAGVQAGDTLILRETRQETAVAKPVPTLSQTETVPPPTQPAPKKKGIATWAKITIAVFILVLLCACLAPCFLLYSAFSQFSASSTSAFPLPNIKNPLDSGIKPDVIWQFPVADTVMAAPAVDDGVVYFGVLSSESPDFYALDAATGQSLWQFSADDAISWTPALSEDKVFFSTDGGNFYALDRAAGTELWRFKPEQRNLETGPDCDFCALKFSYPMVAGNTVYIGSLDHHLYALDANTGAEKWRFDAQNSILDKPAIADNTIYFGTSDGILYAVDAQTGQQIYRVRTSDREADGIYTTNIVSTPIIEEDKMYITDGGAAALNRQTGETIWRFTSPAQWFNISKRPLADDHHLYVMDDNTVIYALNKNDGSIVWQYNYPEDYIYGDIVLNNGTLYFGDTNSLLIAIDAQTGEPQTTYNLSKYQPLSSYETSDFVFTPAIDSGIAYLGWANQMNAIQLETP